MRRLLLLLSSACVASFGLVPAAWAQSDPQVDPNSPAGKEYELPIDRARDEANPGRKNGQTQAPLFGEGVDSARADSSSGSESDGSRGSESNGSSGSKSDSSIASTGNPELGTSKPETVRAQTSSPESGSGSLAVIGAGAGGVLLIGGLAGWAWRRRSVAR